MTIWERLYLLPRLIWVFLRGGSVMVNFSFSESKSGAVVGSFYEPLFAYRTQFSAGYTLWERKQ